MKASRRRDHGFPRREALFFPSSVARTEGNGSWRTGMPEVATKSVGVHTVGRTQFNERDMLVLSRRCGEEIVIGENIRVTVLSTHGGHVRLGVTAPRSVAVDREEIHERRNLMLDACDRPLTDAVSLQEFHDLLSVADLPRG